MVKIALIGCGKVAEKHMSAYKKIDGVDITVSDIVPQGLQIAKKYDFKYLPNPTEVIKGDYDAIDICVPTPVHFLYTQLALSEGKHVFCEKPLCPDDESERILYALSEKKEKVLQVGYLYRFHTACQFASHVVDQEIIGKPHYAIFRLGVRGNHKAWKHMMETGGGVGNEVSSHMLDLAYGIFGSLIHGHSNEFQILADRHIENDIVQGNAPDLIISDYVTSSGVTFVILADMLSPSYMNYLEIHGSNGSLLTSILPYFTTMLYCKEAIGDYAAGMQYFKFPEEDLFQKELTFFVDNIRLSVSTILDDIQKESLHEAIHDSQHNLPKDWRGRILK